MSEGINNQKIGTFLINFLTSGALHILKFGSIFFALVYFFFLGTLLLASLLGFLVFMYLLFSVVIPIFQLPETLDYSVAYSTHISSQNILPYIRMLPFISLIFTLLGALVHVFARKSLNPIPHLYRKLLIVQTMVVASIVIFVYLILFILHVLSGSIIFIGSFSIIFAVVSLILFLWYCFSRLHETLDRLRMQLIQEIATDPSVTK